MEPSVILIAEWKLILAVLGAFWAGIVIGVVIVILAIALPPDGQDPA